MKTWSAERAIGYGFQAAATAVNGLLETLWPMQDVPQPPGDTITYGYEPDLSDNELVAVRQLIEERFPLEPVSATLETSADTFPSPVEPTPQAPGEGAPGRHLIPLDDDLSIGVDDDFDGSIDVFLVDGQRFRIETYDGGYSVQTLPQHAQ